MCATLLRLTYHAAISLRTASPFGLASLLASAAVEASLLLTQPAFATVTGGVFRLGDASKAVISRAGRTAWSATNSGGSMYSIPLLVLAALALAGRYRLLPRALRRGMPGLIVYVVAKVAAAICVAALFPLAKALAVWCAP